jgi:hypothetical protein
MSKPLICRMERIQTYRRLNTINPNTPHLVLLNKIIYKGLVDEKHVPSVLRVRAPRCGY